MCRKLGSAWTMLHGRAREVTRNARLAAVLGRFRTIAGAYLSASLVSGLLIALPFLLGALAKAIQEGRWQEAAAYTLTGPVWLLGLGFGIGFFVAVFAFAPVAIVIGLAEAAS